MTYIHGLPVSPVKVQISELCQVSEFDKSLAGKQWIISWWATF